MLKHWLESHTSNVVLPAYHLNCWYFNLIKGSEFLFLLFWLSRLLVLSHSLVLNKCRIYIYRICNLLRLFKWFIKHCDWTLILLLQFWISFKLTGLDISLLNEHREMDLGRGRYSAKRHPSSSLFDTCGILLSGHVQFSLLHILSVLYLGQGLPGLSPGACGLGSS